MPRPSLSALSALPFVPVLVGFWACVWRFRQSDELGGLAFGLGGVALMIVVAIRFPDSDDRSD